MQVDACRDGLDGRQIDMIVGVREHLPDGRYLRAAIAALGEDIACRVGARTQRACHAGMSLAPLLLAHSCVVSIGFLPARWRQ